MPAELCELCRAASEGCTAISEFVEEKPVKKLSRDASIPNCQVLGTIMAGKDIGDDEIVDRLYKPDVIYL